MCLKIKPNHLGSIFNLANAFFNLKRYEDSLGYYEGKKVNANNFQIIFSYAKNLFLLDRYDEAHKYLSVANNLSKIIMRLFINRLNKLYLKSYNESLELFNKSIESFHLEPDYYHGRGRAYLGIKNSELAMKDFEMAISLGSKKLDEVYYHISSTQILKNKNDIDANYQMQSNLQNLSKLTQIIIGLWLIYQFYIYRKLDESIEIANRL